MISRLEVLPEVLLEGDLTEAEDEGDDHEVEVMPALHAIL